MGAIAESFVAYAQPLIDETDGSIEQLNETMTLAQLCFNLALLPADRRAEFLREAQGTLGMDDAEFEELRRTTLEPMIRRHEEMFPAMHRQSPLAGPHSRYLPQSQPSPAEPVAKSSTAERYAPCPCNSGKKFKFCCGQSPR